MKCFRVWRSIVLGGWARWYFVLVLPTAVLLATGLVEDATRLHGWHPPHKMQVEAFLDGRLSLGDDPAQVGWDLAWGPHGVQQPWGLGLPLARLPFDLAAKAMGHSYFPDRVLLWLMLALAAYFVWRLEIDSRDERRMGFPELWIGFCVLLLFPPLLALLQTQFLLYEEVVVFGYLTSILIVVCMARVVARGCWGWFPALCALSGFIVHIRPTFGAYGMTAIVVCALARPWRAPALREIGIGLALFGFCACALLYTNDVRFGSALEFGHALNFNLLVPMRFASRFGHPMETEPILSAASDLFGMLFLTGGDRIEGMNVAYTFGLYPGQSGTFRWRELYSRTYDATYLLLVCAAWVRFAVRGWVRWVRRRPVSATPYLDAVSAWSMLSTLLLAAFYLRFPFLSSRYLLDFGPAFAAAAWVAIGAAFRWASAASHQRASRVALGCAVLGWWVYQVLQIPIDARSREVAGSEISLEWGARHRSEAVLATTEEALPREPIDSLRQYEAGYDFERTHFYLNGSGWNEDGTAESAVLLWIHDPEKLELDVSSRHRRRLSPTDCDWIQARIGLERLERESIVPFDGGVRITFRGPRGAAYRHGPQVAVLGMVRPEELTIAPSPFRLLRVAWR